MAKPTLTCPKCGYAGEEPRNHGETFLYLEEVTNVRPVVGFSADGVLEITGCDHIDIGDDGMNARLQCCNCLAEFPIPAELELDFV